MTEPPSGAAIESDANPRCPGFVAAVMVEAGTGALFTIGIFEDQASLFAASPLAARWMTEHGGMLEPDAIDVATGEVVAQKGL